ncbi:transposase [Candidatus Parcubacteria bacterium]|nr:transposase [Candidatus Parcubacteria bacterium]
MSKNYNPRIHHRQSMRLENYDYSQDGYYFTTICAKNKIECFGEIIDGKMVLNECGEIVKKCWYDLPNHYHNCRLDEFIIMPNHNHGIIIIDNSVVGTGLKPVRTKPIPTGAKQYSLSEIIRGFKTFSSRKINEQNVNLIFRWQSRFYDHIIRNEKSLDKIREYIVNNPLKWELDRNNPENLYM